MLYLSVSLTNHLENFINTSGKNKILFLKEGYADSQGLFTYDDKSRYEGEWRDVDQ